MPTVEAIREDLDDGGWLKRYRIDDGFGQPDVAFILCTFWLVEALARLGRDADARAVLERVRGISRRSGCCRRTSSRRAVKCGAISRRRTRTSA